MHPGAAVRRGPEPDDLRAERDRAVVFVVREVMDRGSDRQTLARFRRTGLPAPTLAARDDGVDPLRSRNPCAQRKRGCQAERSRYVHIPGEAEASGPAPGQGEKNEIHPENEHGARRDGRHEWRHAGARVALPKARSILSPGPAISSAARPTRPIDWVTDFEKQTGCKVNVKTAATSDEMVTLMNEGGFDLVTASGDASLRLVAGKTVQPINTDLIPSWKTVDERLQDAPWYTVDGKHYGVPYQWGPNVLMYNTNVFKKPPTSWNVVFEEMNLPDGKSEQGPRPGL